VHLEALVARRHGVHYGGRSRWFRRTASPVIRLVMQLRDLRWLLVLAVLGLAGCSSDWTHELERSERANTTPPVNYKSDIVAFMHTYLNDPIGVRDAFMSEPALQTVDGTSRYVACVRYNARKSDGRYAGSKDSLVLFRDGRLDRIIDNARERCRDAAYRPFPELERMQR
jgi:hypothetical protein